MMKKLLVCGATALVAGFSLAQGPLPDNQTTRALRDIQQGRDTRHQIETLRVKEDAIIGGGINVGGTLAVEGSVQVSGLYRDVPTALSVTNGQAVTIAEQSYIVSGIGSPDDNTNTVTLADPGTALLGLTTKLFIGGSSSNLLGLADSGNLALTAAFVGDNYDNIVLYALETNKWVEIGRSDN